MIKFGLGEVGFGLLLIIACVFGYKYWSNSKDAKAVPALKAEVAAQTKINHVNEAVLVKREEARAKAQVVKEKQDAAIDQALQQSKVWADSPVPDDVIDALSM